MHSSARQCSIVIGWKPVALKYSRKLQIRLIYKPVVVWFFTLAWHFEKYIILFAKSLFIKSSQHFLSTNSDHHFFFAFLKQILTSKSSANFQSPQPNGQGLYWNVFYFRLDYNILYCNRCSARRLQVKVSKVEVPLSSVACLFNIC
jgi:hypothetical protein